jgi:hypothetical protein
MIKFSVVAHKGFLKTLLSTCRQGVGQFQEQKKYPPGEAVLDETKQSWPAKTNPEALHGTFS